MVYCYTSAKSRRHTTTNKNYHAECGVSSSRWLSLTGPAGGHDNDDQKEEDGEAAEAEADVAAALIEAELLAAAQQEAAALLLTAWQTHT